MSKEGIGKIKNHVPITFGSAEDMLHYVRNNGDLYNAEEMLYVFHYSADGAIAVYDISEEEAKKLSVQSIESDDEYWGAFLGAGGRIYDVPDEHHEDDYAMEFCEDHYKLQWYDTKDYAAIVMQKKESTNRLVGFVWCHGNKDFECWESDALSEQDQNAIEEILIKYDTTGTSERNVYDRKFSDVFSENYGVVRKKKETELTARERAIYLYAKGFFDAYCPYTSEDERDYCAYNFKQMWETDFKESEDADLKDWLKTIISMWPEDLYVIPAESEEA